MKDEGTEQALKEMVEALFLKPEDRAISVVKKNLRKAATESWKIYLEKREEICSWDTQLTHEHGFYDGVEWAFKIIEGKP